MVLPNRNVDDSTFSFRCFSYSTRGRRVIRGPPAACATTRSTNSQEKNFIQRGGLNTTPPAAPDCNTIKLQVLVEFEINVRQTSVCRLNFDKLKLVGHQTAPLPPGREPLTCRKAGGKGIAGKQQVNSKPASSARDSRMRVY